MKKLIFIAVVFISAILNCNAQPNGGFENWSTQYTYENPDNWQTLNFVTLFGDPLSAFKATGVDKHSGNYALKLKTIFLNNNPVPGSLADTMGYVFTGKINTSPPSLNLGIPYTGRPEKLEFWSKYTPVGTDIAGISVVLKKWNGSGTDTIADGYLKIDTIISVYTFFQIYLTYHSTDLPDSVIIAFSSSYKKSIARVGSTLFIDDVALTGWVGINQYNLYAGKIKVFPNPAKDNITINAQINEADNVQITDVTGNLTGVYKIQNYNANINTGAFAEGTYLYEIRDKVNKALTRGKFNVTK
jgi:hypothetical protein